MKRTTVMADAETLEKLRALARDRGVPFAEVVREALSDKAAEYRPRPESLGVGRSTPTRTGATKGSRRQPPRQWR
jgi:hypothetical protein